MRIAMMILATLLTAACGGGNNAPAEDPPNKAEHPAPRPQKARLTAEQKQLAVVVGVAAYP